MKKIVLFGILGFIMPINTMALNKINVECNVQNENVVCDVTGYSDNQISTVEATIEVGENLTLTSIEKDDTWYGEVEINNNMIQLLTADDKTGEFAIANIKAKVTGDTYIALKNIQYSYVDADDEKIYYVEDIKVDIKTKTDKPEQNIVTINGVQVPIYDNITKYNIEVPYEQNVLNISATLQDGLVLSDIDTKKLEVGLNTISFKIVDEDKNEIVYTVDITRKESNVPANPNTGNRVSIIFVSLMLILSIVEVIRIAKKKYFKKI